MDDLASDDDQYDVDPQNTAMRQAAEEAEEEEEEEMTITTDSSDPERRFWCEGPGPGPGPGPPGARRGPRHSSGLRFKVYNCKV